MKVEIKRIQPDGEYQAEFLKIIVSLQCQKGELLRHEICF